MCPSYKATRDRRYSPKGRAMLMREWLRLLADRRIDPRKEAERLRSGNSFARLPARLFNSLNPKNRIDFSHEVREAMDSCLACKACAGQCPVKVSVPAFRSKFLELYYGRYLRPLKDPLVSAIETTLPWMRRIRPLYNLVAGTALGKRLMRVAGLTSLPLLPKTSLQTAAGRLGIATADPRALAKLSVAERQAIVVFVPDAFTASFEPDVVIAAIKLAQKMGLSPLLAASHVNGKALHVHGYIGRFEKAALRTTNSIQRLTETGVTLVGIDPSMTLAFRSEYKAFSRSALSAPVLMPQEWLASNLERLAKIVMLPSGKRFQLLPHCTERSNAPASTAQWKTVFDAIQIKLETIQAGCCGMAGTFGHETRNRAVSEQLYAMSWADPIAASSDDTVVMATGYSCRSQAEAIDAIRPPHPLEVLNELLGQ